MWNLSTANIGLKSWFECFRFPSPCSLLLTCHQRQESPACLCVTDLAWTLHRCTRLSERVGDQRRQHQGSWKARSQRCVTAPSVHLSPGLTSRRYASPPLCSPLSRCHACPSLAAVYLCLPCPLRLLIIPTQSLLLSRKFSPCFLVYSIEQARICSVHFLKHFPCYCSYKQ